MKWRGCYNEGVRGTKWLRDLSQYKNNNIIFVWATKSTQLINSVLLKKYALQFFAIYHFKISCLENCNRSIVISKLNKSCGITYKVYLNTANHSICFTQMIKTTRLKYLDTRNLKERDILFDWIAIKKIFHRTWCVLLPRLHELLLIDGPKFTKCIWLNNKGGKMLLSRIIVSLSVFKD